MKTRRQDESKVRQVQSKKTIKKPTSSPGSPKAEASPPDAGGMGLIPDQS